MRFVVHDSGLGMVFNEIIVSKEADSGDIHSFIFQSAFDRHVLAVVEENTMSVFDC